MKNRLVILMSLVCLICANGLAQINVKGVVKDSNTLRGLSYATIAVFDTTGMLLTGVEADMDGMYKLNLTSGRYTITAQYVGYKEQSVSVTLLGDDHTANFSLAQKILEEVTLLGRPQPKRWTNGILSLSQNDINKQAASFDDPTRLAMKSPGAGVINDQANGIVYRGIPSYYNAWSLNGAQIVNPNHTSNAGTSADIAAINAGGVNMFGGQGIYAARFYSNPNSLISGGLGLSQDLGYGFPNSYYQLSLLGLEAGYRPNRNFSANYRYSFTGLLGQMGVDFGGERISFQDAKVTYGKEILRNDKYAGRYSFIAAYGRSSNDFSKSDEPTTLKEFQDISYDADIIVVGGDLLLSNVVSLAIYYSQRQDNRTAEGEVRGTSNFQISDLTKLRHAKLYMKQHLPLKGFPVTFDQTYTFYDININYRSIVQQKGWYGTYNAMVTKEQPFLDKLVLKSALKATYHGLQSKLVFNPYLGLNYHIGSHEHLSLKVSHQSQDLPALLQGIIQGETTLLRSYNSDLTYSTTSKSGNLQLSAFGHYFKGVPVLNESVSLYNNVLDYALQGSTQTANESARSYGLSIYYQNDKDKNKVWTTANASAFRSEYKLGDNWYRSSNDFAYTANLSIGAKLPTRASRTHYISISGHIRGGERVYPIADTNPGPDYITDQGLIRRLRPFYRIDARWMYKSGKGMWSLDIQNITGRKNDGFYFVDQPSGKVTLSRQLGLLPLLSYKRLL